MRPARLLITSVALCLSLLVGCARSEEGQADAQSPAPESGAGDSVPANREEVGRDDSGRAMRLTPEGVARSDARSQRDADEGTPAPTRTLDPRDSALAGERLSAAPQYPVDEVIGSLRTSGLSQAERAARASARAMLAGLVKRGAVRTADLLEPRPSVVFQLEELSATAGAATVRVGRTQRLPTGEVSVRFLVLGESSWRGELILEMAEGQWYTSDLQASELDPDETAGFAPGIDNPASW